MKKEHPGGLEKEMVLVCQDIKKGLTKILRKMRGLGEKIYKTVNSQVNGEIY